MKFGALKSLKSGQIEWNERYIIESPEGYICKVPDQMQSCNDRKIILKQNNGHNYIWSRLIRMSLYLSDGFKHNCVWSRVRRLLGHRLVYDACQFYLP